MNHQKNLLKFSRLSLLICILTLSSLMTVRASVTDFDGDGKSDVSVFRPADGYWYIRKSSGGYLSLKWGLGSDNLVPGDYDGDGKTDVAVHRKPLPSPTSDWYILRSQDFNYTVNRLATSFIGEFVIPTPADFDGDGKIDSAYYGINDVIGGANKYYVRRSSTESSVTQFLGISSLGDRPIPADYDGDGKADYAVYRNGTWFILQSSNGALRVEYFGLSTDKVVPGDFDGDGKADIAVWRPSDGFWYLLASRDNSVKSIRFGLSDDKPVPADYDGDGKTDVAVFRPSNGIWYLQQSTSGFRAEPFGFSNDIPLPNVFVR